MEIINKTQSIIQRILWLLLFGLLLGSSLPAQQIYIWVDFDKGEFYCFDRNLETLIRHSPRPEVNPQLEQIVYVSNFVVASYLYNTNGKSYRQKWKGINRVGRGGLAILDIRDNSYREIEISRLVPSYFSVNDVRPDTSGTRLLLTLITLASSKVNAKSQKTTYFKWDINSSSTPTKISDKEYVSIPNHHLYYYKDFLFRIKNKNIIPSTFIGNDYPFIHNGQMMVWAHEEQQFYTLLENISQTDVGGLTKIYFLSFDGLRRIQVAKGNNNTTDWNNINYQTQTDLIDIDYQTNILDVIFQDNTAIVTNIEFIEESIED